MSRDARDEAGRLGDVYQGYARDPRKQRAWSLANPGNRALRSELTDAILAVLLPHLAAGGNVLDVGCGSGWLIGLLEDNGVAAERLHGIDLSRARVDAACRIHTGAAISVADARAVPLDERSVRAVLFVTTLSSMAGRADRVAALGEARRVVEGDGVVIWYEPRVPNPMNGNTHLVRIGEAAEAGFTLAGSRSLTPVPALTRRLGRMTPSLFPALAAIPPLRTHRLVTLLPA